MTILMKHFKFHKIMNDSVALGNSNRDQTGALKSFYMASQLSDQSI